MVIKSMPKEAESAQVFVGAISTLSRARFVMVRLAQPTVMPEIVEASLPIRFVFVILGPPLQDGSYHELGRSIATLMANKVISNGGIDRWSIPIFAFHTVPNIPSPLHQMTVDWIRVGGSDVKCMCTLCM